MMVLQIAVIEGSERYSELARLTAWGYHHLLTSHHELADGYGNCWIVSAVGHGVARALNLSAQMVGGKVRKDGRDVFDRRGHYWVDLGGGIILDSPRQDLLMIGRADQRGARYIPLLSMRTKNLLRLSEATRQRFISDPPPAGLPL
jgi:hypothetical protein